MIGFGYLRKCSGSGTLISEIELNCIYFGKYAAIRMLNMLGPAGPRMDRKSAYHVDIDRQLRQGASHPVSMELDYVDP
jgi:hypothetical protein